LFIQALCWDCTMQLATDLQNLCKCHFLFSLFLCPLFSSFLCVISYTGRTFFCALGWTESLILHICMMLWFFLLLFIVGKEGLCNIYMCGGTHIWISSHMIFDVDDGEYEDHGCMDCDAMWFGRWVPMFWRSQSVWRIPRDLHLQSSYPPASVYPYCCVWLQQYKDRKLCSEV